MLLPLVFCFWQVLSDPIRPTEQARLQANARTASFEQSGNQQLQLGKRDFEKRFNALIDAIKDFSEAYNQSAGSTWPSNKARALRRAMHNLEHSGPLGGKDQEQVSDPMAAALKALQASCGSAQLQK
jgi:hypothetical protein